MPRSSPRRSVQGVVRHRSVYLARAHLCGGTRPKPKKSTAEALKLGSWVPLLPPLYYTAPSILPPLGFERLVILEVAPGSDAVHASDPENLARAMQTVVEEEQKTLANFPTPETLNPKSYR